MKKFKKASILFLSLLIVFAMIGCGSDPGPAGEGGEDTSTEGQGVDLKAMLKALCTSEDALDLTDRYTSTAEIPDANVDPGLVGTWKTADGSTAYTFDEDGTARAAMELYGENAFTFTCFSCGDYTLIAEDLEMVDYSSEEEKTVPVVSYTSYKIENDALYLAIVESADEHATQSITQIIVLYKADENGDITASVKQNPVSLASFYGEWTYGDNEERTFTIDENGFALDGEKPLPVAYNEAGKLVIGGADDSTEYSAALALERLYDNTDGKKVTGENYALGISYTGKDEKDRPNLADAMDDWHSAYGYDQFYFSLSAKTPLN